MQEAENQRLRDQVLQWGRRPRTAEMVDGTEGSPVGIWLQWGRRPRTAEMARETRAPTGRTERFNGAAVRGRRKWGHPRNPAGLGKASMGPPSEDGGNLRMHVALEPIKYASMGPPSEDGGNYSHVGRCNA